MRIYLPEDLERKFRKASMENFGYSRGSFSKAAEQAVRDWVRTREVSTHVQVPSEPVKVLRGLLRHVKKGSVQLQHKSVEIRFRKARGA